MSFLFPKSSSVSITSTPSTSDVIRPSSTPASASVKSGTSTPSFLGSSVLPSTGGGAQAGQRKLLGQ